MPAVTDRAHRASRYPDQVAPTAALPVRRCLAGRRSGVTVPDPEDARPAFRLLAVPGVTVDKWARVWSERQPAVELRVEPAEAADAAALLAVEADAGLLRMPVDQDTFHAIPLYTEVTVVVVQRDHLLSAGDELTVADLADEMLLSPMDNVIDWTGVPGPRPCSTTARTPRPTPSNSWPPGSACSSCRSRWPAPTSAATSPTAWSPTPRRRRSGWCGPATGTPTWSRR
ncbi:LysR substrate-binding domain-containing protein [Catellatospora coxensis]